MASPISEVIVPEITLIEPLDDIAVPVPAFSVSVFLIVAPSTWSDEFVKYNVYILSDSIVPPVKYTKPVPILLIAELPLIPATALTVPLVTFTAGASVVLAVLVL